MPTMNGMPAVMARAALPSSFHTMGGIFMTDMPGARILKIVTTKLMVVSVVPICASITPTR